MKIFVIHYKKLINNYWTKVLDCDKPSNTSLCENGCYW